jgi:hypothetical protein
LFVFGACALLLGSFVLPFGPLLLSLGALLLLLGSYLFSFGSLPLLPDEFFGLIALGGNLRRGDEL